MTRPAPRQDQIATLIGGIPAVYVGTALLLAGIVVVCLVVARWSRPATLTLDEGGPSAPVRILTDERRLLVVALTVMALVFFVLPTRVHERYLYPALALGAILAASSVRWRIAYVVLALASFANLYAILLTPFYKNPGIKDWLGIGDAIRSPLGVTLVVVGHVAVFAWALTELRPEAVRRLDIETLGDALSERARDSGSPADPELPTVRREIPDPAGWALAPAAPEPWREAVSVERGPSGGLPLPFGLGAVRARLSDRSRGLHGEGGGRFDRLDVWLLVVIVVASLVLRTFRLSEPYRMHFDEVYHARTATEFLQDWRYGEPHSIYEFTHPHLAKYAMAVGLIVAGDDRVTAFRFSSPAIAQGVEPIFDEGWLLRCGVEYSHDPAPVRRQPGHEPRIGGVFPAHFHARVHGFELSHDDFQKSKEPRIGHRGTLAVRPSRAHGFRDRTGLSASRP